MTARLNDSESEDTSLKLATYIDSGSRRTDDIEEQVAWGNLKKSGTFATKVLVTTSVLDNGFSIKDKHIKNIVICSHDKTEFIQELGRCRLLSDQTINLFIKKLSKQEYARLKIEYQRRSDVIFQYFGETDSTLYQNQFTKQGDPVGVVQSLWNNHENICRFLISLVENGDNGLVPHFNNMARWRNQLLGKQLEYYESLQQEDEESAPSAYKANWLTQSTQLAYEHPDEYDLDVQQQNQAIQDLLSFLNERSSIHTELIEGEETFKEFSRQFLNLYKQVYPKATSINRGRSTVGCKFIQNRLVSLETDYGASYTLQPVEGKKNAYFLARKDEHSVTTE